MGGAVRKWFSRDLGLSSCRARREHLPEVIAIACSTNNSANRVPAALLSGKVVQSKTQKPGYPFPP